MIPRSQYQIAVTDKVKFSDRERENLSTADDFIEISNELSHRPETNGVEVVRGLEGVVADTTSISHVIPEMKALSYRGYPVHELADNCSFEEVAYLVLQGELPTCRQLEEFKSLEESMRKISPRTLKTLRNMSLKAHPMDRLIAGLSFLGLEDQHNFDDCSEANLEKSIRLMAAIPTLIAANYRLSIGKRPIPPDNSLGFAENFLVMCFGKIPHKRVCDSFETSLILYAEHTFNASTFTARVIASTLSDIYSSVIGGVCAIKGHLHGGANEDVMHMLKDIEIPSNALPWLRRKLKRKEKIPGFGHRIYKKGDSRYPIMKRHFLKMSKFDGKNKWYQICDILEKYMIKEKGIYPNLDFASGPTYYLMGFAIDLFTPLFVIARTVGWTANIMEQYAHNKLIRPLSLYSGVQLRKFIPKEKREI